MGVHTSIYRERDVRSDNYEEYSIKLFKGDREIELFNPVSLREEFYFGKSIWAINEWFYQWQLKKCKKWGNEPDDGLSYEWINEECIYLSDLKELLQDVERVLKEPERAEEILPMPKNLRLVKPKEEYYDKEKDAYIMEADAEWEDVQREEMYNKHYFENLRRAKDLLERLIREDDGDLICKYIVDVG